MSTGAALVLAADGVALILLAVVLAVWARTNPRVRRLAIAGAGCVTVACAVLLVLSQTAPIPPGWVTVLHEGRSLRNVRQLYGMTANAGPAFYHLLNWLTPRDATTLLDVVQLNASLAVVNTIVFAFLAGYVLRSWWASIGFAVGYAANLNTLHAAMSETPAMLWTTYFWFGCIAAAVIDDRAHTSPVLRRVALLWLALLATLAALTRQELSVIGVPAVLVGLVEERGLEGQLRGAARRGGELLRAILAGPLPVFMLTAAALFAISFLPRLGHLTYAIEGLAPLNLSFLLLPHKLGIFLSAGFIALFGLGWLYGVRHCLSFFLLPITLLVLFKVHSSATQGQLEGFRYLTFLTPVVFFLALFGFRQLSHWAEQWGWPSWWKRPAVLLLVLACATAWQPMGPREIFGRRQRLPGVADAAPLLGLNQQTEVRYLLDLVARYPTCVFMARAPQSETTGDAAPRYRWGAFGGPVLGYLEMPQGGEPLEQAARQLAPGAACVLFYRSLDCNLLDYDGCQAETAGREALEERVLENLPYSDISSYGAHHPEIRLGVYPVVRGP